jgi:hypothetical protein
MSVITYHHWSSRRLLRRLTTYTVYVRCGCQQSPGLRHVCKSEESCARADFARMVKQLIARAGVRA